MASSKTQIWNMALSHLGVGKEVASATERSEEANACARFYDNRLLEVLSAGPWSFATKIVAAELIEEEPNDEWSYCYRYPVDCVTLNRVLSGIRNDHRQSRIPFMKAGESSGTIFFCDLESAEIEYVYLHTNPQFYPPKFTKALSYGLAADIAPRITGMDNWKLKIELERLYEEALTEALKSNGNEYQPDDEPDPESIRARS